MGLCCMLKNEIYQKYAIPKPQRHSFKSTTIYRRLILFVFIEKPEYNQVN